MSTESPQQVIQREMEDGEDVFYVPMENGIAIHAVRDLAHVGDVQGLVGEGWGGLVKVSDDFVVACPGQSGPPHNRPGTFLVVDWRTHQVISRNATYEGELQANMDLNPRWIGNNILGLCDIGNDHFAALQNQRGPVALRIWDVRNAVGHPETEFFPQGSGLQRLTHFGGELVMLSNIHPQPDAGSVQEVVFFDVAARGNDVDPIRRMPIPTDRGRNYCHVLTKVENRNLLLCAGGRTIIGFDPRAGVQRPVFQQWTPNDQPRHEPCPNIRNMYACPDPADRLVVSTTRTTSYHSQATYGRESDTFYYRLYFLDLRNVGFVDHFHDFASEPRNADEKFINALVQVEQDGIVCGGPGGLAKIDWAGDIVARVQGVPVRSLYSHDY